MPQWFIRGLRRGVVTTRYPARPDPSSASLPTPPSFRAEALARPASGQPPGQVPGREIVADLLVAVCPSAALRRDGDYLVFDVGACTACGACRDAAPQAVAGSGEFELAATGRGQLVKRIPLREEVTW
jgi:formate hydrogenlyase subunit 6/NADH:ubiquinone oxidoreductase subunit I